jgi:hypothetical protein
MLYGLTAWRLDLEPRCCTICSGAKLSSSTSTWSEKCHAGKAWPRHLDMVLCPSMSYVVLDPCEIPQIISLPYLILHVYCPHARTSEPVSFCLFVFYQQVRVASFKTLRISKTIIRIEISSLIASVSKLKKNWRQALRTKEMWTPWAESWSTIWFPHAVLPTGTPSAFPSCPTHSISNLALD